jgi:MFS family permease
VRLPERLAVLSEREYRLLILGQTASLIGDGVVPVALSFAVLDLTGSVADVGFVLAARSAPLAAFLLVGGAVADRLPRRTVMIGSDATRFVSQGLLAALLLSGHAELWHLLALQAIHGTGAAFFMPAVSGLIPETVSRERLQEANALRWMASSAGGVVGPVLAGVLVTTIGAGAALAVDSASFGISAFFLAAMTLPALARPAQETTLLRDLTDGWREFGSRTWLVVANALAALANVLLLAPFFVLGPAVAKRYLDGAGSWAVIVAGFGAGSIVGGIAAFQLRPRRPMLAGLSLLGVYAPLLALMALHTPAWAIAPLAFVAGGQLTFGNALWETTLQQLVPAHLISRLVAYDWLSALVFQPLGYAVVGLIAGHLLGLSGTLWLGAASALVLGAVAVTLPAIRRVEAPGAASPVSEAA